MNCLMQLKSMFATPILMVVGVTPRKEAVSGAAEVDGAAVDAAAAAAVVAVVLLVLLLQATSVIAATSRIATTGTTRKRPISPPQKVRAPGPLVPGTAHRVAAGPT